MQNGHALKFNQKILPIRINQNPLMSHFIYRDYNFLPNYYGYAYMIPQTAAWANYTVPFLTPPGEFYQPHYYYPRNDFEQQPTVPCHQTHDNRFCPEKSTPHKVDGSPTVCGFTNGRAVTSTLSMAECQSSLSWPMEYLK